MVSLHSRVTLLENGGDWMLGELTLWTAFLPLGRRFSVDAVRASLRARRETTAAELPTDRDGRPDAAGRAPGRIVSLAVLALILCSSRTPTSSTRFTRAGRPGGTGTAVHYVMHQDRMVHLVRPSGCGRT